MLHPHYTTATLPLLPGSSDVIIIVAFFELFSLFFSSLSHHSFIGFSSSCPASSKLLIGQKKGANMCNNKSSSGSICRQRKARKSAVSCTKPAARKTRSRTRKPKYLSLKLGLISPHKRTPTKPTKKMALNNKKKQLDLFPIHPENLVPQDGFCKEEEDMHDHDDDDADDEDGDQVPDHDVHVAFLFESATDDTSTSLHGLLDSTTTTATTTTTTSEEGPISPSIMYTRGGNGHGSSQLERLRTAMRRKERDASEDRWVSYWEVVKKEQEEVTSSSCFASVNPFAGDIKGLVGLKLDYQGVLNAWSDKAPLYVESEAPQTVPVSHDVSNVSADGNLWTVPELGSLQMEDQEGLKLRHREASLRRYKEKRHNRLFSKQIRYEVRKINAEKRPRLKGRFVKRSGKE